MAASLMQHSGHAVCASVWPQRQTLRPYVPGRVQAGWFRTSRLAAPSPFAHRQLVQQRRHVSAPAQLDNRELLIGDCLSLVSFCLYKQVALSTGLHMQLTLVWHNWRPVLCVATPPPVCAALRRSLQSSCIQASQAGLRRCTSIQSALRSSCLLP